MDKQQLCEVLPVIEKAAPIIGSLIGSPVAGLVAGLLGAIVNCNPNDEEKLLHKLKHDPDLYAKLKQLEESHGEWLKNK